ncbi:hypothetical protein H9Q74_000507 [Fusarium xylarioides]|nr:hypothetical protein H9Q71_000541 [Fusarium xylarioides]KAG5829461.1 hypothetical protein H9Q74_000507 [Fusarium xylarioides]
MSSHDFLVSKCGSLSVTVEQLLSTLTALRTAVSIETPQKKRATRFTTRVAERSDNSATDLLWRILSELDCLVDRSQALQSQVEDINGIILRRNDSNPAELEDGNNTIHTVSQSTESRTITGSDQQADSAVVVSDSVMARSVPLHSLEAEGDDITDYCVTQVPTTPNPDKWNSMISLNARPESGTSTRSSRARYISPASSTATHLTWPESPACAFGQDASIPDVGYTEDDEQAPSFSAENIDATASKYKKAIADHEQPQSLAADNKARSLDPHQPVLVDDDDTNALRNEEHDLAVQIHSHEDEDENDAHGLNTRPEAPSPTGTATTRFMSPSISCSSAPQATAILSSTDMERLVPKLAEIEREGVGQHISVPVLDVNLADIQDRVDVDDENWQYTSIRYDAGPEGQGYASVYISHSKPSINWPAFTTELGRPTTEEARDIFENTIQNPPEGEIPYCVGHANILSDKPLNPGSIITENPAFKDLHAQCHHIGGHLSANRIRCEEMTSVEQTSTGLAYRGLRSYNEVYFGTGYKLWLAIAKHHIAKFDAFIKANWSCNKCNQAVSHQNLLLAPSRLKKEGIDYIIAVVGRGEAFWTLPGQQHATINFGYSAARSIKYSHPEDKLDFKSVIQCSDCGMFEVGKKYGAATALALALGPRRTPLVSTSSNRKRKAHQELPKTPCKMRARTNTATRRELSKIEGQLTAIPYHSPRIDRQNPSSTELDVYKRAAAVRSKLAIQQFSSLVQEWRQKQSTVTVDPTRHSLDQAVVMVKHCTGKARLQMLRLRLAQRRLAQETDKLKGPIQINHQPAFLDDLASRHGMTKTELQGHLRDGRRWDRICGPYDGLLPFILLDTYNDFGISKREWTMLGHREHIEEADAFHSLLDDEYIKNLSAAGKVFEDMISGAPVVFLWEESGFDLAADNVNVLLKQYAVK